MISQNRIQHIVTVANRLKAIVESRSDVYGMTPDEAFILGYLHDIGYEFTEDQTNHCFIAGEILRNQGYKYWQEVYWHGIPQEEYKSNELMLLNYVDMTTSPNGEQVSLEERIDDIIQRYGGNSIQAKNANLIIEKIKSNKLYPFEQQN